jgi:hypothetical protein
VGRADGQDRSPSVSGVGRRLPVPPTRAAGFGSRSEESAQDDGATVYRLTAKGSEDLEN